MDVKGFGDALKRLRLMNGIQQQEIADSIGISRPGYSKIERGENKALPSLAQIAKMAKMLGVSTDILLASAKVEDTSRYTEDERILMEDPRSTKYIKVALARLANDLRIAEEQRLDLAAKPGNYDNTLNLKR